MCALKCPAWRLQDLLVDPVVSADYKYTAIVQGGLVYLAGCFHPDTNEFLGVPHPQMVEHNIRLWMQSMSNLLWRRPY
jgi:hypothetical protein